MNEKDAKAVAKVLGGYPWNSGGGIWLVRQDRPDGSILLVSTELVCVYDDEDALDENRPSTMIQLEAGLPSR